jgi:type 1 glutamine amidotransferase
MAAVKFGVPVRKEFMRREKSLVMATMALLATVVLWPLSSCRAHTSTQAGNVPEDAVQKITAAMPATAPAKPQRARKLLVFTLAKGFVHSSIPHGALALELIGRKTGAFTTVVSNDPAMFDGTNLQQFDAVCLVSTTGNIFDTDERRKNIIDFVQGGKGVVGIHAATDSNYDWPQYVEMIGGWFDGHPWNAGDTVSMRVEDTKSPLTAAFTESRFDIKDEIYQFREYSRSKQRVLLGLDMSKTPHRNGMKRADNDYPVSWAKNYGQGRVFYSSLGHREDIYWNPQVLRHFLAGIQFAMGDLKAEIASLPQPPQMATPVEDNVMGEYSMLQSPIIGINSPTQIMFPPGAHKAAVVAEGDDNYRAVVMLAPATTDAVSQRIELTGKLENGVLNLSGKAGDVDWVGVLRDGKLTLNPANDTTKQIVMQRIVRRSPIAGARPPQNAVVLLPFVPGAPTNLDGLTNTNWTIMEDGSIMVRSGETMSKQEFGDMQLHIEWMTPYMPKDRGQGRGNSGVYLQNRYEVQVLDSFGLDPQDNDAGGIYKVAKPRVNASFPPGQWQTYDIMFRAPRLNEDGSMRQPAMVTVVHNGETIHENQIVPGPTGGGENGIVAKAPIKLQDHGNPVRFRNIWVVEQNLPDGPTIPRPAVQMPLPAATAASKAAAGKAAAPSTRRNRR